MSMKTKHLSPIRVAIISVVLLIIALGTYLATTFIASTHQTIISDGAEISYVVPTKATDYQKACYEDLKIAINSTQGTDQYGLDVSSAIVKNFIADFYTWTNKEGTQDVGGLQFVFGPSILNIYEQARAYFYHDLSYNIEQFGSDNLLQISNVKIKNVAYSGTMTYNSVEYQTFYLEAEWSYADNSVFSPAQYQTFGNFGVLVNPDSGKYEIYKYYID